MIQENTNRRDENAALRRNAIVDAALDEFAEKGFAAARMQDIAKRAGVAKGTIYLNFSDSRRWRLSARFRGENAVAITEGLCANTPRRSGKTAVERGQSISEAG